MLFFAVIPLQPRHFGSSIKEATLSTARSENGKKPFAIKALFFFVTHGTSFVFI